MRIINGYLVIWWADGTYSAVPMLRIGALIIFSAIAFCVLWLIGFLIAVAENRRRRYVSYLPQLPAEIETPEPADHYKEQTTRLVELKKKLDAETDLAESYVRAMQVKGELYELPEVIDHERAKRRARGK